MHPLYPRAHALTAEVLAAVLEVKKHFGVGTMLEKVYQKCLARELELRGHKAEMEVEVPITYKGYTFEEKLRIDILVDRTLVIECKAVDPEKVNIDRFRAQALTYLKLMNLPLALVVNFGTDQTGKKGVSRVILKGADAPDIPERKCAPRPPLARSPRTQGDSEGQYSLALPERKAIRKANTPSPVFRRCRRLAFRISLIACGDSRLRSKSPLPLSFSLLKNLSPPPCALSADFDTISSSKPR